MVSDLSNKFHCDIKYSCQHCLKEAYEHLMKNEMGYVTDEELIECLPNVLRHM